MIQPPEGLTLVCFLSSNGYWTPYALIPAGPSPIRCDKRFNWVAISHSKLLEKPKGARYFMDPTNDQD